MIPFTTKLYAEMTKQLQSITFSQADEYDRAMRCFHIAETTMMQLKAFIKNYKFQHKTEEINFFKNIKPKFHSQHLYYVELTHIILNRPPGEDKALLRSYYRQLTERINLHFTNQQLMCLYYKTKRSNEDDLLFLRESDCTPIVPEDCVDMDTHFSTVASSIIARLMAFELVLTYIAQEMDKLERKELDSGNIETGKTVWTLTKTDLVELGYALHASKAINFGRADIKQIMDALGQAFRVDLKNSYKIFQNIRIRQDNRTTFMDEAKKALVELMDETDMNYSG